jgi:ABC-type multidrug transport system fused ATPase/permease subunit
MAMLSNVVLALVISALARLIAIAYSAPAFIAPGLLIGFCGGFMGQVYIKAQMLVKRERSNAKSPVVSDIDGTFAGLASIRAFGVQGTFVDRFGDKINKYTHLSIVFNNLQRWISIRMQVLLRLTLSGLLVLTSLSGFEFCLRRRLDCVPSIRAWICLSDSVNHRLPAFDGR